MTIVVAVLIGIVVGLVTGILVWIQEDSNVRLSRRVASALLRAGPACAATILLVIAIFVAAGVPR